MQQILSLVKKDLLIEWRQKHILFGVLLYVGSTVFALYMMSGQPDSKTWNTLFWLTELFIAVNAVAKSFLQEPANRFRYYYTLVKPTDFLFAKMIYSVVLLTAMSMISFLLFALMLGNPLLNIFNFVLVALVGNLSLSVIFTFLSAIAARANQNASLMAVLGFPLMTPLLMMISKLALKAISPVYQSGWWTLLLVLLMLDMLIVILGWILFPFLWQE